MRMRSYATAVLISTGAFAPTSASAWDYAGHRIVGGIADIILQERHPKTHERVKQLLEQRFSYRVVQRTLRESAVFPDCAKDEPEFCGRDPSPEEIQYVLRNLVHPAFHFTNSPLQQKTYRAGGAGTLDHDVVQMINHAVAQLGPGKPYFKFGVDLTDLEALWLLAHLVGDIHQPLHVGQPYFDATCANRVDPNDPRGAEVITTRGGNSIRLDPPLQRNIHLYWDVSVLANAMREDGISSEEDYARRLAATPPSSSWRPSGPPLEWAEQWYAEAILLAEKAYDLHIDGEVGPKPDFPSTSVTCRWKTSLAPAYQKWASDVAREQVHKAGHRLAALLVAIFEP